jgi:hypothetical protein
MLVKTQTRNNYRWINSVGMCDSNYRSIGYLFETIEITSSIRNRYVLRENEMNCNYFNRKQVLRRNLLQKSLRFLTNRYIYLYKWLLFIFSFSSYCSKLWTKIFSSVTKSDWIWLWYSICCRWRFQQW